MSVPAEQRSYTFAAYRRLLRENRNFRLLWLAQVISETGDWLYSVAVYSLLLDLTGTAKSVGLAITLQLLPQVFVAPTAGVLNDRLSRRAVMIFSDLMRVAIVGSMLFVRSADHVWLVYVLLFIETILWALFEPGRTAIVPNLCRGEKETLVANALSSSTWSVNLTLGAGLGGLIAVAFGRDTVFILNALSFLGSAALLGRMRFREPHTAAAPPLAPKDLIDYTPIAEGVRYVTRDARRYATMLVKAGMGLLGAHWVILPLFGERVFPFESAALGGQRAGMLAMSFLFAARGAGSLAGSLASGYLARNEEPRMRAGIFWGFVLVTFSYIGLSAAPSLAWACCAVLVGHAGTSMAWVYSTTMLQNMTEDRFRGRVFSADYAGLFLVMSAVSYLAGVLIDAGAPLRAVALATGLLGIVPAVLWLWAQRFWRENR